MWRSVKVREWPRIDAALAKAIGHGFQVEQLAPDFRRLIRVEVSNRHFIKYHLGCGFALHHFTGVDLGPPHDHPCDFTTMILEPYTEDVFVVAGGGWTCERMTRHAGSVHTVSASTVHKIVGLPGGSSWTLVRYGRHVRPTRFYRFGEVVESRTVRQRLWRIET